MIAAVGVLAGVAVALGWVTQGLVQVLPAGALVAMLAVLAAASPPYRRELSSCIATIGLLTGTVVIVHLTGGLVQAHVLFLIVVAAVTLYQTWAPFWTAVVFATVHYGVLASLDPTALNPGAATADPWLWAGVHGALIGLAALVGIVAWRSEEVLRTGYARLAERNDAVLACVVDGILAIDAGGRIRAANPAAHELLGCEPVGRDLGDVLAGHEDRRGGGEAVARLVECAGAYEAVEGERLLSQINATPLVVTQRPLSNPASGDVVAVVSLRDLRLQRRAELAERQLATLAEHEAEGRRAVRALAVAVHPDPLVLEGARLGVTYLPAERAPAGGDHYDWLQLPDGAVQLVVVDAMGRGVSATKQALTVSSTVRTLTLEGCPLLDLLRRTGELLRLADAELIATVLVARYHPSTGAVSLAGAGHPPALHVRGGAARAGGVRERGAREIDAPGVPLGCPGAGSESVTEVVLAPGDTLLLYTDGLIEGTRDVQAGLDALASAATAMSHVGVQEMADRLLVELPTCARNQDDCLVLALRHDGPAQAGTGGAVLTRRAGSYGPVVPFPTTTFSAVLASVPAARRFVVDAALDRVSPDVCDTLALLTSEVAANAVTHAHTPFQVSVQLGPALVRVETIDASLAVPVAREVEWDDTGGRGLALLEACSADWGWTWPPPARPCGSRWPSTRVAPTRVAPTR